MRRMASVIVCVALLGLAAAAHAQTGRVSLEGRGGFTMPSSELKDRGASNGFASALELIFSVRPALSIYTGVSRDEFDGGFSSTGLQGGAKFIAGRDGTVMPWIGAGLNYQKLNNDGEDSDFALGADLGAGADFAITNRFTLTPGLRWRGYTADFGRNEITTRYLTFTLGAHLHLR